MTKSEFFCSRHHPWESEGHASSESFGETEIANTCFPLFWVEMCCLQESIYISGFVIT